MKTTDRIRYILNILFMIGVVITIILYVITGKSEMFFYAGFISLALKIFEFILRFVY